MNYDDTFRFLELPQKPNTYLFERLPPVFICNEKETQKSLSQLLGKKIRVEDKAHSDFQPTVDEFKLEPDMSGGKGLVELVTGATPYRNARIIIIKYLGLISNFRVK